VSWNNGPAKKAILSFIDGMNTRGPNFVAPVDRIATFDNDGTLWVEQPAPPQFDFIFRTWRKELQADPSLAMKDPYKALVNQDRTFFEGVATQDPQVVATLEEAMGRSWSGTTPEEFDAQVRHWAATTTQPKLGVHYTKLVYQPMLELFDLLKANDFRVFVCSGGGRDFMRVLAEDLWGIYKENVIGSAADYEYKDGTMLRTSQMYGRLALGAGKPEHIFARTGRLPVFAGGNADVDIEMLACAKFALFIHHDDDEREFAYTKAAEKALATAKQRGWTVVSMKNDWKTVFSQQEEVSK
jgi:phosphoserine phosphatase